MDRDSTADPQCPPVGARIKTKDGLGGVVEENGGVLNEDSIQVRLHDGRQLRIPAEYMHLVNDGTYLIPLDLSPRGGPPSSAQLGKVIPVVHEELDVNKRVIDRGGVRVSKHVDEREVKIEETLLSYDVEIERTEIGRLLEVSGEPKIRFEGDTIVVPLLEEVLVLETRLILREEVRIKRVPCERSEVQTVALRSEHATIERLAEASGDPSLIDAHDE